MKSFFVRDEVNSRNMPLNQGLFGLQEVSTNSNKI